MAGADLTLSASEPDRSSQEPSAPASTPAGDTPWFAPLGSTLAGAPGNVGVTDRVLRTPVLARPANTSVRAVAFRRAQQTHGNRVAQRAARRQAATVPARSVVQRACACGGTCASCAQVEEPPVPVPPSADEEQARLIQRQENPANANDTERRRDPAKDLTESRGQAIDPESRTDLESRFGRDLSDVRVHTDEPAARAADTLHAEAFTTGQSIYFAEGQYAPRTTEGRHLLAHEVAHTIQQSEGRSPSETSSSPSPNLVVGAPHDPLEREADRAADAAMSNSGVAPGMSSDSSGVVRRRTAREAVGAAWSATGGRAVNWAGQQIEAGLDWVRGWLEERAPWLMELLRGDVVAMLKDRLASSVDDFLGGFLGRVRREGLLGALSGVAGETFSTITDAVANFGANACAALVGVLQGIIEFQKWLGGKTFATLKRVASAVAGFFSEVWNEIGAPAWKAIKAVAADVWDWIEKTAARIWRTIKPLWDLGQRVWAEVKRLLGIAWDTGASVLDWLKEKALAGWEKLKAAIQPIMGPLKVVGAALLLLSPLGPIILIGAVGVGLWYGIKWLINNWKTLDIVVKAQAVLRDHILPAIRSGIAAVSSALKAASQWLREQVTRIGTALGRLMDVLGVTAFLRLARNAVSYLGSKLTEFGTWLSKKFTELIDAVLPALREWWAFMQPIYIVLLKLTIVILNPLLWPIYISAVIWLALPECVKPPIIDYILDLLIAAIKAIPSFKSFGETWSQIQTAILKGLRDARNGPMSKKLELANRVANMIAGGTLEGYGNLIEAAKQMPDHFVNEAEAELTGINRGEPLPFEQRPDPTPEEQRIAAMYSGMPVEDAEVLGRDVHSEGSIGVSHVANLDVTPELLESLQGKDEVEFGQQGDPTHSVAALQADLAAGGGSTGPDAAPAPTGTEATAPPPVPEPGADANVTSQTTAGGTQSQADQQPAVGGMPPDVAGAGAAPDVAPPATPEEQIQMLMADQAPIPCTTQKPPEGPAQANQMPPQPRLGPFTPDQRSRFLWHQLKRGISSWYECHKVAIWAAVITAVVLIVVDLFLTGGTVSSTIMEIVGAIMIGVAIIRIAGLMAEYLAKAILGDVVGAAKALARALAAGAIEIVFALMFSAGALLKQIKNTVAASVRLLGKVAPRTAAALTRAGEATAKGLRAAGEAVTSTARRAGNAIVRRGRIILDGLPPGIARRVRSIGDFLERLWAYGRRSRLRFKRFKLKRAGRRLQLWGEVNPWVLLADGSIVEVEDDAIRRTFGRTNVVGEPIDLGAGRRGIVIGDDLSRLGPAGRREIAPGVRSTAPVDYPVLRVDYRNRPDVVPPGVILEFPNGTKVWRLRGPEGGIAHESLVGPSSVRRGFERDLPGPGEVGLRDTHRAHTLGQGTGFESPYAIPYAPSRVNLALQNDGIEELLRGLRSELPADVLLIQRTETRLAAGGRRLEEIVYRVDVVHNGQSRRLLEFDINVGGTRTNPTISYGSPFVNPDPSAGGILNVVDVPQRVADRLARIQAAIARRRGTAGGVVRRRPAAGTPSIEGPVRLRMLQGSQSEALDAGTRRHMEAHFNVDLGEVRLHRDGPSTDAAAAVRAEAFTTGRDIFFAEGKYEPKTTRGLRLIAHELSHVVDHGSNGGSVDSGVFTVDDRHSSSEREADAAAEAAVRSEDRPAPGARERSESTVAPHASLAALGGRIYRQEGPASPDRVSKDEDDEDGDGTPTGPKASSTAREWMNDHSDQLAAQLRAFLSGIVFTPPISEMKWRSAGPSFGEALSHAFGEGIGFSRVLGLVLAPDSLREAIDIGRESFPVEQGPSHWMPGPATEIGRRLVGRVSESFARVGGRAAEMAVRNGTRSPLAAVSAAASIPGGTSHPIDRYVTLALLSAADIDAETYQRNRGNAVPEPTNAEAKPAGSEPTEQRRAAEPHAPESMLQDLLPAPPAPSNTPVGRLSRKPDDASSSTSAQPAGTGPSGGASPRAEALVAAKYPHLAPLLTYKQYESIQRFIDWRLHIRAINQQLADFEKREREAARLEGIGSSYQFTGRYTARRERIENRMKDPPDVTKLEVETSKLIDPEILKEQDWNVDAERDFRARWVLTLSSKPTILDLMHKGEHPLEEVFPGIYWHRYGLPTEGGLITWKKLLDIPGAWSDYETNVINSPVAQVAREQSKELRKWRDRAEGEFDFEKEREREYPTVSWFAELAGSSIDWEAAAQFLKPGETFDDMSPLDAMKFLGRLTEEQLDRVAAVLPDYDDWLKVYTHQLNIESAVVTGRYEAALITMPIVADEIQEFLRKVLAYRRRTLEGAGTIVAGLQAVTTACKIVLTVGGGVAGRAYGLLGVSGGSALGAAVGTGTQELALQIREGNIDLGALVTKTGKDAAIAFIGSMIGGAFSSKFASLLGPRLTTAIPNETVRTFIIARVADAGSGLATTPIEIVLDGMLEGNWPKNMDELLDKVAANVATEVAVGGGIDFVAKIPDLKGKASGKALKDLVASDVEGLPTTGSAKRAGADVDVGKAGADVTARPDVNVARPDVDVTKPDVAAAESARAETHGVDDVGQPVMEGGMELHLSPSGQLWTCASPCRVLRERYASVISKPDEVSQAFHHDLQQLERRADAVAKALKSAEGRKNPREIANINKRAEQIKKDAIALGQRIEQANPGLAKQLAKKRSQWVLLSDGTFTEVDGDVIQREFARSKVVGEPIDLGGGKRGIIIGDDLSRLNLSSARDVAPGVKSTAPLEYPVLHVDYSVRPDVVPPGVILEFPGGHRVWRLKGPDGGIAHESVAGDPKGRRHLEKEGPRPGEVGLEDTHRAHTLGQGTGFESPYAIPFAPKEVNLALQNDGIEELLRGLNKDLPEGVVVHIRTETRYAKGTRGLQEIVYRVDLSYKGESRRMLEFNINVAGTEVTYGASSVASGPNTAGVMNLVDVPQRVADRMERIKAAIAKRQAAKAAGK